MAYLPLHIIADILSRLEVKPLLCFRCVSSEWRNLIDSSDFIRCHLNKSIETNSNQAILFHPAAIRCVSLDSLCKFSRFDPLLDHGDPLDRVIGSCNGLLCVYNKGTLAVWNPFRRKYRFLPFTLVKLKECLNYLDLHVEIFGFGYDLIHDDYKVISIRQISDWIESHRFPSQVRVYSLARNEWKCIRDMPYVLSDSEPNGVYASGALHWVAKMKVEFKECDISYKSDWSQKEIFKFEECYTVVAFDLTAEDYKEVALPEFVNKNLEMQVGALGGKLCMVVNECGVRSDVWMMKEYGVKDSWTKLFSVLQQQLVLPLKYMQPLGYFKGGREVLLKQNSLKLLRYDLEKEKVENFEIDEARDDRMQVCLESLVLFKRIEERNRGRNQLVGNYEKMPKGRILSRFEVLGIRAFPGAYTAIKDQRE